MTDTASSDARLYGSEAFAVPTRTVNAAAEPDVSVDGCIVRLGVQAIGWHRRSSTEVGARVSRLNGEQTVHGEQVSLPAVTLRKKPELQQDVTVEVNADVDVVDCVGVV